MNVKEERFIKVLRGLKLATVNSVINRIFENDVLKGEAIDRGPFYYTHLNKLPTKLEELGIIEHAGFDIGATNREEKLWQIVVD